jgi:hypothetical protein
MENAALNLSFDSGSCQPKASSRPAKLSSKVTNGKRIFAIGGDGRGAWTRRWKDLYEAHMADLGGEAVLSQAQTSLCRRAAALSVELEQLEAKMSEGAATNEDLDLYNRLTGNLRRFCETLGLERRAKPIEQPLTLQRYLQLRAEAEKATGDVG